MWRQHLGNLLYRSWNLFIVAIGSTTLGFAIPIVVPAVIFMLFLAVVALREGKAGVKTHLRKTLGIAVMTGILGDSAVYLSIYGYQVVREIYQDHVDLVQTVNEIPKPNPIATTVFMRGDGITHALGFVIIGLNVSNPHASQRSLVDWRLWVSSQRGRYEGMTLPVGRVPLPGKGAQYGMALAPEQNCNVNMVDPLVTGGSRNCWVWAAFKPEQLDIKGTPTYAQVTYQDVVTGETNHVDNILLGLSDNVIPWAKK